MAATTAVLAAFPGSRVISSAPMATPTETPESLATDPATGQLAPISGVDMSSEVESLRQAYALIASIRPALDRPILYPAFASCEDALTAIREAAEHIKAHAGG